MPKKNLLFIYCLLLVTASASAQEERGKNEVGLNVGAMFYQGDLTPNLAGTFKTARPGIGFYYNRILSPYWSARANIVLGKLEGDDAKNDKPAYMRRRNLNFYTPLAEVTLMGVFNVFGDNVQTSATKLSPYVFAGAGVAFVNIKRDWSKIDSTMIHAGSPTLAGLIKDTTTALPKAIPVLPLGAGIK